MPGLAAALVQVGHVVEVLQVLGQGIDAVGRQPQRLAHVADGRAGPIGDHFGGHSGPLAAVFLIKILDHLFPPLVLEIDVDVRGLVALAAHEPLEQQVHPLGIDGGHAQAVTDRRIGGRSASLAEDAAAASEADQVPDGEKIGLVTQLGDQAQLMLHELPDLLGNALGITPPRTGPGQPRQVAPAAFGRRGQFFGIFITQLGERKRAAIGDLQRPPQRVGRRGKSRGDFLHGPQVPLGVGKQVRGGFGHSEPWRMAVNTSCSGRRWGTW